MNRTEVERLENVVRDAIVKVTGSTESECTKANWVIRKLVGNECEIVRMVIDEDGVEHEFSIVDGFMCDPCDYADWDYDSAKEEEPIHDLGLMSRYELDIAKKILAKARVMLDMTRCYQCGSWMYMDERQVDETRYICRHCSVENAADAMADAAMVDASDETENE